MARTHDSRLRCDTCGDDLGPDHRELNVVSLTWHRILSPRCALYIREPELGDRVAPTMWRDNKRARR